MHILMFGWEFPPFIHGGLGVACFELTKALTALNHSISFVMPLHTQGGAAPQAMDNLTIITLPALLHPYLSAKEYERRLSAKDKEISSRRHLYGRDLITETLRYGQKAAATSATLSFDVIHSHDWMTIAAAIHTKDYSSRPWIHHVHSLEYDRSGENANRQIVEIEREGMKRADRVIAVSFRTKRMITDLYGIHPDKVTVIYNAVTPMENGGQKKTPGIGDKKKVLFLGRITFQKGPDYFVEAAALVLKAIPDVIFVMAGDGDMLNQMVHRVKELGIAQNFHFPGFLSGEELERVFTESDLYIMPSVSEPFGISVLEAISRGLPVIISRQSGVSEIIDNALKVNFWDVKEIASMIVSVLRRPALAKTLTAEAKKELEGILWQESAKRIVDLYTGAVHNVPDR